MVKKIINWIIYISIILLLLLKFIVYPWFIETYGPTEPISWGIVGTGYFDSANFDLVKSENERYKKFGINVTNFQCYVSVYVTHIDDSILEKPEIWMAHVAPLTKLYKLNENGSKSRCSIEDFKKGDLVNVKIGESGIDGNLTLYILEMNLNQKNSTP